MAQSYTKSQDTNQQEVAKWSAIFQSLTPLKKRTILILESRYGPKVGRFLNNPSALGFLINWDFKGSSLGMSHLQEMDGAIDPNQLLREVSILEAYGNEQL